MARDHILIKTLVPICPSVSTIGGMPFRALETASIARCLGLTADRDDDQIEAYFERSEVVDVPGGPGTPGFHLARQEGVSVRLVREGRSWLASQDGFGPRAFIDSLRQVARALPRAPYAQPRLEIRPAEALAATELLQFPANVTRAVREQLVAFPIELRVSRHRRWSQVVGPRFVPAPEEECFYSLVAEMPWGRFGCLLSQLDQSSARRVAASLIRFFRARDAKPPPDPVTGVVMAPQVAAVLLHEAVAHALEADTLALGGNPAAAIGVRLGSDDLNVLDDPASAPPAVCKSADDEGQAVHRRWLLRGGVVEQPLADSLWARSFPALSPGAARRGSRHLPPVPRSTHLELLAGSSSIAELLEAANGGLYLPEVSRGRLDPHSGRFELHFPLARRIQGGKPGDWVGACSMSAHVADLLGTVVGVGRQAEAAGAGWCAKGGQRLPVWATTPPLLMEGVEVTS